jgi:hypothetical protein
MIPRFWNACFGALVCFCLLAGSAQGSAQQFTQFFTVDCSNPSAQYPTISSALAVATDGASIWVQPGTTCTENVTVGYLRNIAILTGWLQTFNLAGNLTIQSSHTVEIQGMVVTNPFGDGITVNNSSDVTLTFVSSINNAGRALVLGASQVTIAGGGTFSNNARIGIDASTNSTLSLSAWGGTIDISNNVGTGINLDRSVMIGLGNTTINNTQAVPGNTYPNGFGINEFGGAKAGTFGLFGPVTIASNAGGGVSLEETSEISLAGTVSWAPYQVNIQGNGPLGVAAVYGGSLTLFSGVTISGHTVAGVSLYGNSQAAMYGANNVITNNGTGADSHRAGIQVEQGSQAYVSNTAIQNNGGPGILALLHATLDVEGSTFSSNASGAIVCDASVALQTDLPHSVLGSANACKVSSDPGGGHQSSSLSSVNLPDWKNMKARSLKVSQLGTLHHPAATPVSK